MLTSASFYMGDCQEILGIIDANGVLRTPYQISCHWNAFAFSYFAAIAVLMDENWRREGKGEGKKVKTIKKEIIVMF